MSDDTVWSYTQDVPGTSLSPGYRRNPMVGKWGETVTANLFGDYVEAAARGLVFMGTTLVAGTAIPISTTTAPTFILMNPSDSGKLVIPIQYRAGFASGTGVASAIGYEWLPVPASAKTGTNAVTTTFTDITPQPTLLGSSYASAARFATTATVVTTGSVFLMSAGLSQGAPLTSSPAIWTAVDNFMGQIALKPGNAIYTVGIAAPAEVLQQTITWLEIGL